MDNYKKPLIKLTFRYNGHGLNFDDITQKMNLTPSRIRREADFPEGSKKAGAARDIWEITSGYNESLLVAEEFEKFLIDFEDKIEIINELKITYNITTSLTVSMQTFIINPYPLISHKCIEFAYKTKTEIDIDWYYGLEEI